MKDAVTFILNGKVETVRDVAPTMTVLNYLRRIRRLTGSKEGCAEGDCGACTVVIGERDAISGQVRYRAVNGCIMFVPMLEGKALVTVEGLRQPAPPDDPTAATRLHPVQQAMVDCHGSQCGFCTPGFVMSLYAAYVAGERPDGAGLNDLLAGNLCRCTGYGPILDAGARMAGYGVADWDEERRAREREALQAISHDRTLELSHAGQVLYSPATIEELARLCVEHPDAALVAGATDVGLWITKQHRKLACLIYIGRVSALRELAITDGIMRIGAGVSYTDAAVAIGSAFPDFGELMRRIGGTQVRNAGTIGGNIANGSPIGDTPPALIALGAKLILRKGATQRRIDLEDFFIAYGKQDRQPGEFVEAVEVPLGDETGAAHPLRCYKISKRFDQDISALCGCFNIGVKAGQVTAARLCFGGMAATPRRASAVEAALLGKPWTMETIEAAGEAFEQDYTPLSDMRASSQYRLQVAKNLLTKYFLETSAVHCPGVSTVDAPQTRLAGPGADIEVIG